MTQPVFPGSMPAAPQASPNLGFNPLMAVDTAKTLDEGTPPPEPGDYLVEVTKVLFAKQGTMFVAEYKIVDSKPGSGSLTGYQASYVRPMNGQGWENYLKTWLFIALGIDKAQPGVEAQWSPFVSKIALLSINGVALELAPGFKVGPTAAEGGLIGRKMRLVVSPGPEPKPGKKYYPNTKYYLATTW